MSLFIHFKDTYDKREERQHWDGCCVCYTFIQNSRYIFYQLKVNIKTWIVNGHSKKARDCNYLTWLLQKMITIVPGFFPPNIMFTRLQPQEVVTAPKTHSGTEEFIIQHLETKRLYFLQAAPGFVVIPLLNWTLHSSFLGSLWPTFNAYLSPVFFWKISRTFPLMPSPNTWLVTL